MKRESKYNLPDDDDDEINVHSMLSEKDDFDEEVPFDDESDEEGALAVLSSLVLQHNPESTSVYLPFYPVHSAILFLSMYLHMRYGHAFSVLYITNLFIKTLL